VTFNIFSSLNIKENYLWVSFSFSPEFFGHFSKFFLVRFLVLNVAFWWFHVWDIGWMRINPVHIFLVSIWSILLISTKVDSIMLIEVPCVVSYNVWDNLGMGLNSIVFSSFSLSNGLLVLVVVWMVVMMVVLDVDKSW